MCYPENFFATSHGKSHVMALVELRSVRQQDQVCRKLKI